MDVAEGAENELLLLTFGLIRWHGIRPADQVGVLALSGKCILRYSGEGGRASAKRSREQNRKTFYLNTACWDRVHNQSIRSTFAERNLSGSKCVWAILCKVINGSIIFLDKLKLKCNVLYLSVSVYLLLLLILEANIVFLDTTVVTFYLIHLDQYKI